jgi:acetyl-CoA synthetase
VPWTHLTPIKAAMDGRFHHDIRAGDVVAWPTNVGWMMGPWLIYASLMNGAALALYEGSPGGNGFTRFVGAAGVTMLGVVPSLVRAWRAAGADKGADWRRIRVFSSTGEPSDREDTLWLMSRVGYGAPVIEYCGGTEIGGGYITGTMLRPASPAVFTTPALGLDLVVLDEQGAPVPQGGTGEVYLVPPSIGLSQTLLNADHHEVYHKDCPPGPRGELLRRHGDAVLRLAGGTFRARGRVDDTMNLGGVKVSSLEIEQVAEDHGAVREAAAVAVQPGGEGPERLVLFIVAEGAGDRERLKHELDRAIARRLNPLFEVHDVVLVDELPRTASQKLMRRALRHRYSEVADASPDQRTGSQ